MPISSKHKKSKIWLLYLISVLFVVLNLGSSYLGIPPTLFVAFLTLTIVMFFFNTFKTPLNGKILSIIIFLSPLILLNILNSIEIQTSIVYWALWLMLIISLSKVIQKMTQDKFNQLLKHIPFILLSSIITLYLILLPHLHRGLTTKNSLGLLAGATFIASLSIKHKIWRFVTLIVSLFITLESDSRSSLVFAVGIVAIYLLTNIKIKYSGIYILIVIASMSFQNEIYSYLEEKMTKKTYRSKNINDALTTAYDERQHLVEIGWDLFSKRPLIGYGLKTKYYEGQISLETGSSIHVHNGYVGTLLEVGVFISLFVFLFVISVFFNALRVLKSHKNPEIKIWIFFILFGFARAYGENYLFFNIGNIFSILFIFLCMVMIYPNKKLNLV